MLRDERHADEETSKQSKGKRKKDKDQDKGKQIKNSLPKEAGTAAAAKAWRHSQLVAGKGAKRYTLNHVQHSTVTALWKGCHFIWKTAKTRCLSYLQAQNRFCL